jgi:phosphatidylglycerol:prolipoprotein diacylglycerol transferase
VPLLPVQLIEAALVFGLFFLLRRMSRRRADGRRMLGWYLLLYSVGRFVLELFRGDAYRGFIGALSVSQVIALLSLLGGGLLLWWTHVPRKA